MNTQPTSNEDSTQEAINLIARELFKNYNPDLRIESEIGQRLIQGFRKDAVIAMDVVSKMNADTTPSPVSEITPDQFCNMYTSFYGEKIDNPKQLTKHEFDGDELYEFIQYIGRRGQSAMTQQEIELVKLTGDLWNQFMQLPQVHPHDRPDVCFHIHAIQNIILARSGQREYNQIVEQSIHQESHQ